MHDAFPVPIGTNPQPASVRASEISSEGQTPYDLFMESGGIPVFRDIGISKVRNLPWRPGSVWAVAAPTSSSTAPRESGAATSSRCRVRAPSMPKSTFTRRSTTWWRGAARPKCGSMPTQSATCSKVAAQGSLFSIPVNAMPPPSSMRAPPPALLLGGTTAPILIDLASNVGAVFDCLHSSSATASAAPTTSTSIATTSSPTRCAALPCAAPAPSRTSSTATCRSTTAARPATRRGRAVRLTGNTFPSLDRPA